MSDPNIKTFPFVVDMIDDILDGIDGYMDNKKLLVAVAISLLYEEYESVKNSPRKFREFTEKILAEIEEMKEDKIEVDVRLSARK